MTSGDTERRATYRLALELYGDSVRVLREACRGTSGPVVLASLDRVEREGLLTKALLQSLLDSDSLKEECASILRDRMDRRLAIAPPAIGMVWNPYVLTVIPESDGVKSLEVAIPILLTCVFDSSGVPSYGTWRTAIWDEGLKRIIEIVDKEIASSLAGVESKWAVGNFQFDLDADRFGGGVCEEDRSYELAALVACLSAAFGLALPPGTTALGLVSDEIDPRTQSQRIDSLDRETLAFKIRGLVWSLPVLHTVFVPKRDEGYAAAALGDSGVKVVGVRSVFDVYDALRPDLARFRGRRRDPLWHRITLRASEAVGLRPGGIMETLLFSDRNIRRVGLGAICGLVCALLSTNAAISFLAVLHLNNDLAWKATPFLIVGSELPFIAKTLRASSRMSVTPLRARYLTEIGPIALCVALCHEWRSQITGESFGISFLRLGVAAYVIYRLGTWFIGRFMPGGRTYGKAYLRVWLCATLVLGVAGVLSNHFLWVLQAPLFVFSALITALLSRAVWRTHERHLVGDIRIIAGLSLWFVWLLTILLLVALYPMFLRQHLLHRGLSPFGGEAFQLALLIAQAMMCAFWSMKTTTLFLGGSLYSEEEIEWSGSAEIQAVQPVLTNGDEFDSNPPETISPVPSVSVNEPSALSTERPVSPCRKVRRR